MIAQEGIELKAYFSLRTFLSGIFQQLFCLTFSFQETCKVFKRCYTTNNEVISTYLNIYLL